MMPSGYLIDAVFMNCSQTLTKTHYFDDFYVYNCMLMRMSMMYYLCHESLFIDLYTDVVIPVIIIVNHRKKPNPK